MTAEEIIEQLEDLIKDRESLIEDNEGNDVFVKDKNALEEAVKVLTVIRDKRQVTFTVYPEGVFYDAKEPEGQMWCRGILMEPEEDRPHIKIQYKGEELTIKELTDRLDKASADRDRYKRLSETRKKQIDELEKQYEVTEFCPHCESEITITWDTETYGYKAYCPVCGGRLMLCSACHDDTNGSCDYNGETDTCRFNQNSSSLDTADEIAAKTDFRANVAQLMEEAVKVMKQYNRLVQMKAKPVKQRIKIQYEGEELTIKELVGKLAYLKGSQEYLKWAVVEREKEIALLKKQLADIQPAIISSSNIPLTPEELLEMVGQPVWTVGVSFTDDGKWEMWDIVEDIDKDGITFGYSTESREWWNYNLRDEQGNLLGCAWTCYRQPSKEVQERAETD